WDSIRQPQTTSMVALTAFSRGLDAKDQGDYAAARTQFDQALAADPNFQEAEEERRKLPAVLLSSAGIATAVAGVAPAASVATAGLATGLGISTATLAVGAGVVAAGAGIGAGVGASGGGENGGSRCGNNRREGNEQCDGTDLGAVVCPLGGQLVCTLDCILNLLGCFISTTGQREGAAECHDGNTDNTDDCLNTFVVARCGDGFVRAGREECDDSNTTDGDGCDSNCTTTRCGNDVVTAPEECDDGNTFDGDDCAASCTTEGSSL
ncbi:MAG: DUF4215 domain-containing protein, partial [Candidatus Binatia bacterium]